ncbi:hypothetical protein V8E36_003140 [Tilletia maclaganii]
MGENHQSTDKRKVTHGFAARPPTSCHGSDDQILANRLADLGLPTANQPIDRFYRGLSVAGSAAARSKS